jgi:hypothetical protein
MKGANSMIKAKMQIVGVTHCGSTVTEPAFTKESPTVPRAFTVDDFREIQPGVYKLDGHHVYVASGKLTETCSNCGGKGKAQSRSATGRKTWVKCGACFGEGHVSPLTNVERHVPRTGWSCQGMALSLDDAVKNLNSGFCTWLNQPSYIRILD